jgi:hypothetical protein
MFRITVSRRRFYTEDFLRAEKVRAREAWKRGLLGIVDYAIDKENELTGKVIDAFDAEQAAIKEGKMLNVEVSPEDVARIAAHIFHARKIFLDDLQKLTPRLRIRHSGEITRSAPDKEGAYTVEVPGFIDVPLDADADTLRDLGLEGALS